MTMCGKNKMHGLIGVKIKNMVKMSKKAHQMIHLLSFYPQKSRAKMKIKSKSQKIPKKIPITSKR